MERENKKRMMQYFKMGEKQTQTRNLGVEMEHFIVDTKTKRAVSYEQIADLIRKFALQWENAPLLYEEENHSIMGCTCADFIITLEPAAQLEISIRPEEDIAQIKNIYDTFRKQLDILAQEAGSEVVAAGYQPKSKAAQLQLIPKDRYIYMDRYFQKNGTGGREMMCGTASMQISIDYTSEEDFRKKIQAVYVCTPLIKLLMEHTHVFEGNRCMEHLKRTDIWNRVDPVRTGIIPGVLDASFGYADYVEYVWKLPLIFVPEKLSARYVGEQTARDIWQHSEMTGADRAHLLSMAFPDVRLKNYLEIRGADSVEEPYVTAYAALVKGLFYQDAFLEQMQQFIRKREITEQHILQAQKSLQVDGWNGVVYQKNVKEAIQRLLVIAQNGLSDKEKNYLQPFQDCCMAHSKRQKGVSNAQ